MSAEILRRAAALMRERAEAATPGRWEIENRVVLVAPEMGYGGVVNVILGHVNQPGIEENERNAAHIASWHPAVALAVAEWLELEAEASTRCGNCTVSHRPDHHHWTAYQVARAYLGEPA